jgi:ribosomal protein L29
MKARRQRQPGRLDGPQHVRRHRRDVAALANPD